MTTVLNVKIDEKLKKEAQKAAKELGLPMSIVVAAGLREFVRNRSITISEEPRLKPEVEAELLRISAEVKKGINVSPAFDANDIEGMMRWLNTPDADDDD